MILKTTALNAIRSLVNLVYPKICIACQEETPLKGQHFCLECQQDMYYTKHLKETNNEFEKHFIGRIPLERGAAMFFYRKETAIQQILHEFKYKGNADIGLKLGMEYGTHLSESGFMNGITAIVPVPLHWKKQKKRGYNQAEVFAQGISSTTGVILYKDFFLKQEESDSQTSMDRQARIDNVAIMFDLNSEYNPQNEHILIVDDVLTTGATLEACAKKIDLSINKISMVTLAIGRL